jgi:putative SOS response-associated peptidase YedK
MAQNG